jgi:hypothetical protein
MTLERIDVVVLGAGDLLGRSIRIRVVPGGRSWERVVVVSWPPCESNRCNTDRLVSSQMECSSTKVLHRDVWRRGT